MYKNTEIHEFLKENVDAHGVTQVPVSTILKELGISIDEIERSLKAISSQGFYIGRSPAQQRIYGYTWIIYYDPKLLTINPNNNGV